ncbi:MAG: hypothetical protein ABJA71_08015 [Ginsengibacter sp.]
MKTILFSFFILFANQTNAQDSTDIFVEAGHSIKDAAPISKVYRYSNFVRGKIFFRDASTSEELLNYNLLNAEVEFISPQGDTLAIIKDQAKTIKYFVIDSSIYYGSEYLEQVMENSVGKILRRQQFLITKKDKSGSLNQSSTAAIDTYSSLSDNNSGVMPYDLVARENLTLSLKTDLFFGDKFENFRRANKKNLLKIFFKKKEAIDNYLKTHEVNFNKEDDLKNLLAYLQVFQ